MDVVLILLLSATAGAARYSVREGRAVLSADALQYLDNAEAILDAERMPSFGYRKPGYSYFLAGLIAAFGPHVWAMVAAQYALAATLPLCAYALGRCLHSRGLGWLAAMLTLARLRDAIWPERVMSEVLYAALLSAGVVLVARWLSSNIGHAHKGPDALRRSETRWEPRPFAGGPSLSWIAGGGVVLALAWFVRPVAIVVVASALLCVLWALRSSWSRTAAAVIWLAAPLAATVMIECTLNARAGGPFRPCTGTLGAMTLMRARHVENLPLHDSDALARCLALLPERNAADAYRVNHVDTWIARAHAMRAHGMNEWEIDRLFADAGRELLLRHPGLHLTTGCNMFVRTLLRQSEGPAISRVPEADIRPIIEHPAARDDLGFQDRWYIYWSLPNRSLEDARSLFDRWQAAASAKAPLDSRIVDTLRYYFMTPPVADGLAILRAAGSLWPGFAILLGGVMGLNRRVCLFLGLCYLFDAMLVGAFGASEPANARYQWVWIVPDTALAAALFVPLISRRNAASPLLSRGDQGSDIQA